MICSGVFDFKSVYRLTLILLLVPTMGLAQVNASPQSTSPPVSVSPEGPPGEYFSGAGVELFIFIGSGQACKGGQQGGGGIPSQGPTSCTPTGLVQGYIESENMDLADVAGVTAMGTLSVNGVPVGQALETQDVNAAVSTVSVSPTNGTTYSFIGEGVSCYFASSPVNPPPPPEEPPPCFFECGNPGPEAVSGSQISVQPAFTQGLPFPDAGSCIKISFNNPVSVTYGLPLITSISQPASANIGTSNNSLVVKGSNLAGSAGISSATFVGGTTFNGGVPNPNDNQETVTFSVPSFAPLGTYHFTISNEWGPSNAVNFTVGGPPAVIAGLAPPVWQAGATPFPLIITGSGFGTQPTVTISAFGVTPVTKTLASDGRTITVPSVTVSPNAPNEPAEVDVHPGYSGSTFVCGTCNGASPIGTATAAVKAVTPAPQIMRVTTQAALATCAGGSVLPSGASETVVYAGERVLLCVTPPPGFTIVTSSWTFDNIADITGGFTNYPATGGLPSATGGGSEAVDPSLNTSSLGFFFVNPGTNETATYHWTLSNGDTVGNSSSADFNIQGPTNVSVTAAENAVGLRNNAGNVQFRMGGASTTGITLTASSTISGTTLGTNASFQWVQLLTDVNQEREAAGINSCTTKGFPSVAIDNFYPYPHSISSPATTVNDSPTSATLGIDGESEFARSFNAKTYLLWDPALPDGCTPASSVALINGTYSSTPENGCTSTPIPIGVINWSTSADALQTLTNNSDDGWNLLCANPNQANNSPILDFNSGYPQWMNQIVSVALPNSRFGNDSCQVIPQ
jgi:hypothetical protein